MSGDREIWSDDEVSTKAGQLQLAIVADEASMVAEDDLGRQYDYGSEGFSEHRPDIDAEEWLGIRPDRIEI